MYFIWQFYKFTATNIDIGKAKVCGGKSIETCGIVFFDFLSRNNDDVKCVDAVCQDYAKSFKFYSS